MVVAVSEIFTEVKLEHSLKAPYSRVFTVFGNTTEVRSWHFEKAYLPMVTMSFGITVFLHPDTSLRVLVSMMALQLLNELYFGFPSSTIMLARFVQLTKGFSSIRVTLFGMKIEVKPVQPSNIRLPR
jgi:hypothetical protein